MLTVVVPGAPAPPTAPPGSVRNRTAPSPAPVPLPMLVAANASVPVCPRDRPPKFSVTSLDTSPDVVLMLACAEMLAVPLTVRVPNVSVESADAFPHRFTVPRLRVRLGGVVVFSRVRTPLLLLSVRLLLEEMTNEVIPLNCPPDDVAVPRMTDVAELPTGWTTTGPVKVLGPVKA